MELTYGLNVGDEITVNGLCKDGTYRPDAPPKQFQLWRVKAFEGDDVVLEPLLRKGVLDQFNATCGDFRLTRRT